MIGARRGGDGVKTATAAVAASGMVADDNGFALLDPGVVRLHRGSTGVLRATVDGERACSHLQVSVFRAFPLSDPEEWVVLLDSQGREIGTLRNPGDLDPESMVLLREELELRYLTPHVTEVLEIREETAEGGGWTPAMVWELATDRGRVRLRLPNLADHVRGLGPGRLLLTDREGRRVEIHDAHALPQASRAWLGRYLAL